MIRRVTASRGNCGVERSAARKKADKKNGIFSRVFFLGGYVHNHIYDDVEKDKCQDKAPISRCVAILCAHGSACSHTPRYIQETKP